MRVKYIHMQMPGVTFVGFIEKRFQEGTDQFIRCGCARGGALYLSGTIR